MERKDERTIKQLAQEAYDVQDACNLSGVLLGAQRALVRLRDLGVPEPSYHAIMKLWADKIAHLTGTQALGSMEIHAAYAEVQRLRQEAA